VDRGGHRLDQAVAVVADRHEGQPRLGAELAGAQGGRAGQILADPGGPLAGGLRSDDDRVEAAQLTEEGDRVGPLLDDLQQRPATALRPGERHGADRRVRDKGAAGGLAVHDAEHADGCAGLGRCLGHDLEAQLGRGRVCAVRLHHDRAAGGEGGRGIATRNGERQREVAGPKHRDRTERDEHPAQVGTRAHRRVAGVVDRRLEVAALAQHLAEQAQLVAGARELAVQPGRAQPGLPVGDRDDVAAVGLQRVGQGPEQRRAAGPAEPIQCGSGRERIHAAPLKVGGRRHLGDDLGGLAGSWVDAEHVVHCGASSPRSRVSGWCRRGPGRRSRPGPAH
jgi:hypothetical protein